MPRAKLRAVAQSEPTISLQTKVENFLDIKATIDRLELELNNLKKDLKADAYEAHKRGEIAETETHKVLYVESESRTVAESGLRDALSSAGIQPGVVAKILRRVVTVTPYAYARVIEKKEARLTREAGA